MQHTVLARKYRPQDFESLVGQEHIKRALSNAIANNRLHHAYLFTGTRGVGKTSLARIITKCLNCEKGISATPCNECQTCKEISNGSYPDLLEIDAASRTKVEDTRELLEQIQYAPIKGRFKVFLIDEVHMLSGHSFNALLKTLEEPPEHIKFLLATTDPQKLPITVLSRCLQFNLQPIPKSQISDYLAKVLTDENLKFETGALDLLATAAEGSLRDALSLTDQAISFCDDLISRDQVANILGISPRKYLEALLRGIIENQPRLVFSTLAELEAEGANFAEVLKEFANLLHSLGYAQILPEMLQDASLDVDILKNLAQKASPEEIQLFYQFAIEGRRDLPLAPDARCGAEMSFLRMLAFKPIGRNLQKALPKNNVEMALGQEQTQAENQTQEQTQELQSGLENQTNQQEQQNQQEHKEEANQEDQPVQQDQQDQQKKKLGSETANSTLNEKQNIAQAPFTFSQNKEVEQEKQKKQENSEQAPFTFSKLSSNEEWLELYVKELKLDTMLKALLGEICFLNINSEQIQFEILASNSAFLQTNQIQTFEAELQRILNKDIKLELVQVQQLSGETPLHYKKRCKQEQKEAQIKQVLAEPVVQNLIKLFDAKLET